MDVDRADAFLCGAGSLFDDLTPLLEHADAVAPDFKEAFAIAHTDQTKRKVLNSFWDRESLNYERVVRWIYPQLPGAA